MNCRLVDLPYSLGQWTVPLGSLMAQFSQGLSSLVLTSILSVIQLHYLLNLENAPSRGTAPTPILCPAPGRAPAQSQCVGDSQLEPHQLGLFLLGFVYHKVSLLVFGWTSSQHLSSTQQDLDQAQHPVQGSTHTKGSGQLPHREEADSYSQP